MDRLVYVVMDMKGNGRVVGVFENEAKAEEILAINPMYYRLTRIGMNEVNPDCVRWVQDEQWRTKLERLSTQMRALSED
jgi:hypothetical protein